MFLLYKTPVRTGIVDFEESLVQNITSSNPQWSMEILGRKFVPDSVEITKSTIPVKKPSTRGGVYFSQTEAYKAQCITGDHTVKELLTGTMLGPNTDFTPIMIKAATKDTSYTITANLTSYVESGNHTILHLVITDIT